MVRLSWSPLCFCSKNQVAQFNNPLMKTLWSFYKSKLFFFLTCCMWALFGPLTNSSSSARRFVLAKAKISSVSTYDSLAFFRAICRNFTKSSQFSAETQTKPWTPPQIKRRPCLQKYAVKQMLTVFAGCVDHLHVRWWIHSFNVGVNGLLDQVSVKLSSG